MVAYLKSSAEFLVNTTTLGSQEAASIAALANGGFVIAWQDGSATGGDTSGFAIRAQVYSATGAKVGVEFLVNTQTAGSQAKPAVAALSNGDFVITWDGSTEIKG
jgi:hypothetical protein